MNIIFLAIFYIHAGIAREDFKATHNYGIAVEWKAGPAVVDIYNYILPEIKLFRTMCAFILTFSVSGIMVINELYKCK